MSDSTHSSLEAWAELRGQAKADLARFLIERSMEDARDKGYISDSPSPPVKPGIPSLLARLIDGLPLDPDEEVALAEMCDRAPHNIHNASKKIQEKNGNGKKATAKR